MQNEMKNFMNKKKEVFLLSDFALAEFGSLVKGIQYMSA